ncbi:MAG: hypothetical protein WC342_06650 [Methanoregula sp.]
MSRYRIHNHYAICRAAMTREIHHLPVPGDPVISITCTISCGPAFAA